MSDGLDTEGHLTYREDGSPYPGLCHCARNEAHYACESKPGGGWVTERARTATPEGEKA